MPSCCRTPATRTPPWTSYAATVTTSATTTYDACHPSGHDHLNLLGRYQFSAPDLPDGQLRALRDPAT